VKRRASPAFSHLEGSLDLNKPGPPVPQCRGLAILPTGRTTGSQLTAEDISQEHTEVPKPSIRRGRIDYTDHDAISRASPGTLTAASKPSPTWSEKSRRIKAWSVLHAIARVYSDNCDRAGYPALPTDKCEERFFQFADDDAAASLN